MKYDVLRRGKYAKITFVFKKENKTAREIVGLINAHQAGEHVVQDAGFRSLMPLPPEQGRPIYKSTLSISTDVLCLILTN